MCLRVSEASPAVIYAETQFASTFSSSPLLFCPFLSSSLSPPVRSLSFTFPATTTSTTCFPLPFPLLIMVAHLSQWGSGQSRETMKCQLLTPSSVAYLAASRSSWEIYRACQNQTNNGILHNVAISLPGKQAELRAVRRGSFQRPVCLNSNVDVKELGQNGQFGQSHFVQVPRTVLNLDRYLG